MNQRASMNYLCGTCGNQQPRCTCQPEGWFIRELANMPNMIAKWKRMSTAKYNSVGYPLTDAQRAFAANIVKQVETYSGTAVGE